MIMLLDPCLIVPSDRPVDGQDLASLQTFFLEISKLPPNPEDTVERRDGAPTLFAEPKTQLTTEGRQGPAKLDVDDGRVQRCL